MAREFKVLTASVCSIDKTISHYESFGWKLYSLKGTQIIMARETENPVYNHLVSSQAAYEGLVYAHDAIPYPEKPKKPSKIRPLICLMHFLLAIIPGIIYVSCKVAKKRKYRKELFMYNRNFRIASEEKAEVINKMDKVAFYSRIHFC